MKSLFKHLMSHKKPTFGCLGININIQKLPPSCHHQTLKLLMALPPIMLMWTLTSQKALGQAAVSQLNATYTNNGGDTSGDYSIQGVLNSPTINNHKFNQGTSNDLKLTSFDLSGNQFQLIKLVNEIKINRVNNSQVSGTREIVFYEQASGSSATPPNLDVKPSAVKIMEAALLSDIINRGTDNVFANQNNAQGNHNNIERIDFVETAGLAASSADLNNIGFLVLERGGNDSFKIAAITAIDAAGKPTAFGPLISINASNWGKSSYNIYSYVMRKDPADANLRYTAYPGLQPISAIFFSYQSLGITANQTFYGYALFPGDVTASNDLINLTDFPKSTTEASGGGMDLMAGGGIFALNTIKTTDLQITKTDGLTTTTPGSNTTYTITVKNNGPTTVNSLNVKDTPPASLQNVQFTPSTGNYNSTTGDWTGLNLAPNQSVVLTMTATVSASATGTITNTATVSPPPGVIDSNNANNSSIDTTNLSLTYTISGTLYRDSDGGDDFDSGETTLPANITVRLLNASNNSVIATTTTNATGGYIFNNIANGSYKVQVDTSDTDIPSNLTLGTANDVVVTVSGSNQVVNFGFDVAASKPNLLLVKRITALNKSTTTIAGDNLGVYLDQASNPYDDNILDNPTAPQQPDTQFWPNPSSFLIGGVNGGNVKPGDELEYTIYFLSTGQATAKNVLICDRVPDNVSFLPTAFNSSPPQAPGGTPTADRGIVLSFNGNTVSLTGVSDGDAGVYFAPGVDPKTVYPNINCNGANTNGVVVVNLGDLPFATASGVPLNSYGFIRFRGSVK